MFIILFWAGLIWFITSCSGSQTQLQPTYKVLYIIQYNELTLERLREIEKHIRQMYKDACDIRVEVVDTISVQMEMFRRGDVMIYDYLYMGEEQ